jgi:polysaccharide biosynthesis/export protein
VLWAIRALARSPLLARGTISTMLLCVPLLLAARAADAPSGGLSALNPGDAVSIEVYGQPDLTSTVYVGDDGTIQVPLAGPVQIAGSNAIEAAKHIEQALQDGQYLRNPHVTLTVVHSTSQQVSVLGEVHQPGQYAITPHTTVLDLLARAGGLNEDGADIIFILRPTDGGALERLPLNVAMLSGGPDQPPSETLRPGDSVLIPRAAHFYINGEVNKPNKYPLHEGMTVIEAITLAGGVTPRGSERRVDVKRLGKNGRYVTVHARASDLVLPDDILHIKESLF